MDRRTFLVRGLGSSALLVAFGGGLLALRSGTYGEVDAYRLKVLDRTSFWVLAAVAARTSPVRSVAEAADLAARVDQALLRAAPGVQRDLVRVLYLLENALPGLLFRGRFSVFTKLSSEDQDAALYAWRDSSLALLRGAYQSLRRLCLSAHYSNAELAAEIGYPGPRWKKPDPGPIVDNQPLSPPFERTPVQAAPPGGESEGAAPGAAESGAAAAVGPDGGQP